MTEKPLVAFLLLVVRPGAPSSFLFLVVRPGAPSSVLAPKSSFCNSNISGFPRTFLSAPFHFYSLLFSLGLAPARYSSLNLQHHSSGWHAPPSPGSSAASHLATTFGYFYLDTELGLHMSASQLIPMIPPLPAMPCARSSCATLRLCSRPSSYVTVRSPTSP